MAKKVVNSDIYNLSQLIEDIKKTFLPNETDETLAIGTYGYIGAVEAARLQTQVQMTGELCNEVFPSRARLERNVITHAIMTNIEDINAIPAKMTAFLAIKEAEVSNSFDSNNVFVVDRECPIYIGDYEFHLEYDIKLRRIYIEKKHSYTYTAWYDIPSNRDVPTSTIDVTNQYLSPPAVVMVGNDSYIYLTVVLSQVEHSVVSKKLVTSNIIDNKTMNFEFDNQLAYFEVHVTESDEEYYLKPVFEGSSVPDSNTPYYCWYQYIDSNLIRVRFDRQSYMPGLNANIECLIKTCKGSESNFTYGESLFTELSSSKYGYQNITALLTPVTDSTGGKDRKSKKELQSLIPKEALSRGSLTTITDLNNYFRMLDSEMGRIIIQKKIDNQIERVYYTYFVAKDQNGDVIPSNTIDVRVDLDDMIKSSISETDSARYLLPSGSCFRLGDDGVGYISKLPLPGKGYIFTPKSVTRGEIIEDTFTVEVNEEGEEKDHVSVSVDVGGAPTKTHIFPNEGEDRYGYENSNKEYEVEDYIQMGCGKIYKYSMDYTTKEDNALITIRDKNLGNMEMVDASYTVGDTTRHFNKVPIVAYNIPANTKIHVDIKRRLNEKSRGIVTFGYDKETFKLHQTNCTTNLSTMLVALGIDKGKIENLESSDPEIISVIENGEVNPKEPEPIPIPEPDDPGELKEPYKLQVLDVDKIPPISERAKNQWYYGIESREQRDDTEVDDNTGSNGTADTYKLHVLDEKDAPPISERKEDNWYYLVKEATLREELPDDPEVPVVIPEELTGREYQIEVLKEFMGTTVTLTATIDGETYIITATHDAYAIENGIYITEGDNDMVSNIYKTFVPILSQNKWPEDLVKGDQITYTLRYKSMSNSYAPELKIKLSEGLDYVIFSNTIKYPDGTSFNFEPTEESLASERGFIYTNPYAANVNSYRLYSSFYMMSMEENPYLHFDYINEKSNVQFIATNAYWTRPFYGPKKNIYTLTATLTQSVQDDLGVIPGSSEDENVAPLIKVIAVFRRNNKDYRYRSLNLVSYDPTTYAFTFSQDFTAEDIFDNDSNIRLSNFQVAGQSEYSITLSYNGQEYRINNGGIVKLSTILRNLSISYSEEPTAIISSTPSSLSVVKDSTGLDYDVTSLNDFDGEQTITISILNQDPIVIKAVSTQPAVSEYGFFNPTTDVKLYALCAIPDTEGKYSHNSIDSICPGLEKWTLTNVYDVVNGVTMYHNYSEIMGSRVEPYGEDLTKEGNTVIGVEGYLIKSVPMLGYDYCQNDVLVQNAINALNYRKGYIESACELLENSFGADFKLFNTYGPSQTYYIIRDTNLNSLLDDEKEFIDRVDLTFNFRIKLVAENDSYTKDNIIQEIKEYIEDLDDLGDLHIPNLVTQITNNYKEQVSYFEYLGFNDYGPEIQHIYKLDDSEIPIHVCPEFLNVRNIADINGVQTPAINIYVSDI